MVPIRDLQHIHCSYHALHGYKYVLIHRYDKFALVLVGITSTVDYAHLFDEGRLSRPSRT